VVLNSVYPKSSWLVPATLATPCYEGIYEMRQLQIPQRLQRNIEIHLYHSGHMVYANEESLKELHDNVAAFIRKTYRPSGG
jgi:hypothetical protein